MNWHEFVFSDKPWHRFRRHALFWFSWWLYFALTYFYYQQNGLKKITFGNVNWIMFQITWMLVFIHMAACYFFIYFLLPTFLLRKKYVYFAAGVLFMIGFLLGGGYLSLQAESHPCEFRKIELMPLE